MKRREVIKGGILLAAGATTSTINGCGNSTQGPTPTLKKVKFKVFHNVNHSQAYFINSFDSATLESLQNEFGIINNPSTQKYHAALSNLFLIDKGTKVLQKAPQTTLRATDAYTYTYSTTAYSGTYNLHLFLKKIDTYTSSDDYYSNFRFYSQNPQDKDVVDNNNLPKYKLVGLYLAIHNSSAQDTTITIDNYYKETAKAFIFRMPIFTNFSAKDLGYMVDNFDAIGAKNLENALKYVSQNGSDWFRYQLHINPDDLTALIRKTKTSDDAYGVIHDVGDAIYTYPLRDIFDNALKRDYNLLVQHFSNDKKISSKLLQTQTSNSTLKRVFNFYKERSNTQSYNGISYKLDSKIGANQGLSLSFDKLFADTLTLTATNTFVRHTGLFCAFYDVNDNLLTPNSSSNIYATYFQYIGILPPEKTFMDIPVENSKKQFTITVPNNAYRTEILFTNLSFGNGPLINILLDSTIGTPSPVTIEKDIIALNDATQLLLLEAEAMTFAFELALNALLVAWGAHTLAGKTKFASLMATLGFSFAKTLVAPFLFNPKLKGKKAFVTLLPGLGTSLITAAGPIASYISADIVDSEVEDAIPIAGTVLKAMNIAITSGLLLESLVEVGLTEAINTVSITRQHTLQLQFKNDPDNHQFPLDLTTIEVILNFTHTNSYKKTYLWGDFPVISYAVQGGASYQTLNIDIADQPAGGKIEVIVKFYEKDWVSAVAHKSVNNLENTRHQLLIKQNIKPITAASTYTPYAKFTTDANKNHVWKKNVPTDNPKNYTNLYELFTITVNDPIGSIGYSYKDITTNTFITKNISAVLDTPEQGMKIYSKTKGMLQTKYDLLSSKSNDGNLLFDTVGEYVYVRKIDIDSTTNSFNVPQTKNIGKFLSNNVTQFAYYKSGKVVAGLDTSKGILHILTHLDSAVDDNEVNRYKQTVSTPSTITLKAQTAYDSKTQYLNNPKLLTMSPNGDIIILDRDTAQKPLLRAFTKEGVSNVKYPHFTDGAFYLKQESGVSYLDINIESQGLMYILKRDDSGTSGIYILDIYNPASKNPNTPLVSTNSLNCAKIKVDHWRNVYTLNYEPHLKGSQVQAKVLREPTISIWIPPAP